MLFYHRALQLNVNADTVSIGKIELCTQDVLTLNKKFSTFMCMKQTCALVNYHTHCFLDDGTRPLEEYVRQAVSLGFQALGFSCHAPGDDEWHMKPQDFPYYIDEIQRLKEEFSGSIEIYTGLEVDYLDHSGELLGQEYADQVDYTIGSVHSFWHRESGQYLSIDGPEQEFLTLLEQRFDGSIIRMAEHYFAMQCRLVEEYPCDILAHCDLIKKKNISSRFYDPHASWYRDAAVQLVHTAARKGQRIEVNTGGVTRAGLEEFYPAPWMLSAANEGSVPVVLSSDAHHPKHLNAHFPQALQAVKSAGYKEADVLLQGKWQRVPIG